MAVTHTPDPGFSSCVRPTYARRTMRRRRTTSLTVALVRAFIVLCFHCQKMTAESRPHPSAIGPLPVASNVSLVLVKWFPPAVKVSWQLNLTEAQEVKEIQVIFSPLKSKVRNMMKVKPVVRNVLLENLLPHHEYELELVSVSLNAMVTNATPVMHFISPSNESTPISKFSYYTPLSQEEIRRKLRITMDEIVILFVVLIVWLTVICIFCSKWSKLRHLEPYHPDYRPSCSTAAQSPVYSVDSDNLAGVGALTTTPVASGGVGFGSGDLDLTDSTGLLVGGGGGGGALSTSAAGQLSNVCAELNSALLASIPNAGQAMGASISQAPLNLYAQPAYTIDPGSQCALSTILLPQQPPTESAIGIEHQSSVDSASYMMQPTSSMPSTSIMFTGADPSFFGTSGIFTAPGSATFSTATTNTVQPSVQNRVKQVQFQTRHHSICGGSFKPNFTFTGYPASALAAPPATHSFIHPQLADLYGAYGTGASTGTGPGAAYFTSSVDSSECNSYGPMDPSQTGITDSVQPMFLNSDNYVIHQPSVDSIYIELPSRYHVRSGSTASVDGTLLAMSTGGTGPSLVSGNETVGGSGPIVSSRMLPSGDSGETGSAGGVSLGTGEQREQQRALQQMTELQFQQQLQHQLNLHLQQQLQQHIHLQTMGQQFAPHFYGSAHQLMTAGLIPSGSGMPTNVQASSTISTSVTGSSMSGIEQLPEQRQSLEQIPEHGEEMISEERSLRKKLLLRKGTRYVKRRRHRSSGQGEKKTSEGQDEDEEGEDEDENDDDDDDDDDESDKEDDQKNKWKDEDTDESDGNTISHDTGRAVEGNKLDKGNTDNTKNVRKDVLKDSTDINYGGNGSKNMEFKILNQSNQTESVPNSKVLSLSIRSSNNSTHQSTSTSKLTEVKHEPQCISASGVNFQCSSELSSSSTSSTFSERANKHGSSQSGYSGSNSSGRDDSDAELIRPRRRSLQSCNISAESRRASGYGLVASGSSSSSNNVNQISGHCSALSSSSHGSAASLNAISFEPGKSRKRGRLRKLETVLKRSSMDQTKEESNQVRIPLQSMSTLQTSSTGQLHSLATQSQQQQLYLSRRSGSSRSSQQMIASSLGNLHRIDQSLQNLMSKFEIEVPPPPPPPPSSSLSTSTKAGLPSKYTISAYPTASSSFITSTATQPLPLSQSLSSPQPISRRLRKFRSADDLIRHLGLHNVLDNVQSICKRKSYDLLFE